MITWVKKDKCWITKISNLELAAVMLSENSWYGRVFINDPKDEDVGSLLFLGSTRNSPQDAAQDAIDWAKNWVKTLSEGLQDLNHD